MVAVGRVTTADVRPRLEGGNFTAETDDLGEYRGRLAARDVRGRHLWVPVGPVAPDVHRHDGRTITTMVRRPRTVSRRRP